ncbi:CBASS cGAMP-activated phospholipase [Methylomagnum ishizawai]|uniref:CBASS cGAMP-activated phospholipase n=1 Tax=Methylomagnum ishizawai TaxID=1760988 RepID=UPI001C33EEE4|nr:CBASS cGAMP-activated phospholipase [Methylomagnum ishizawai]BBL77517.1 hypothetical protein similar to Patatin [Methylomagnum ishizawai]
MTTENHNEKKTPDKFQILSLDGGGIKGIFTAALLAAIEEDLNISIINHFDLIAGTSTGGIIAIGLGLGLKPREIVEFYFSQGPAIFKKKFGFNWLNHLLSRKFSDKPLEKALKHCFKEEKRFGDSTKRLVIPTYNITADDIYIFRTPHHEKLRRDHKVPAWKVAKATSAAPTFFPCVKDIDNMRLIDGGVWANNPSLVAVVEACGPLEIPLSAIHILSIGTFNDVNSRPDRLDTGGILAWGRNNAAIDIIMRGQSIGVNNQVKFLLGENHVERLDPKVAANEFTLDGIHKTSDLIGKAAYHSRKFAPTFKEKFSGHIAPEYTPIYR